MRGGHDIDVAVSMLNALEQALHAFERHREFIMKRLKDDNDPRALILKRAPIGDNQDDYDVLENGVIVGRIFTVPTAPEGRPWMWAIRERTGRTVAHGYDPTREAAMAAFAKSWHGQR